MSELRSHEKMKEVKQEHGAKMDGEVVEDEVGKLKEKAKEPLKLIGAQKADEILGEKNNDESGIHSGEQFLVESEKESKESEKE
jgi:hypothetical protein